MDKRVALATAVAGLAGAAAFFVLRRKGRKSQKQRRAEVLEREGQTEYVYTAFGAFSFEWSAYDMWQAAGCPAAGDPVTPGELWGHAAAMGSEDNIFMDGVMARPDAPFVHKEYRLDSKLDEWCELGHEEPMAPHWPTVDPHHHIFDQKMQHGDPLKPPLVHSFSERCTVVLPWPYEQLAKDLKGNNVVATVFIECGHRYNTQISALEADPLESVKETVEIQKIADGSAAPMAIVSHMNLSGGRETVEKVVKAHKEAGKNLVGVRHALAWLKGVPFCSRIMEGQAESASSSKEFREGMEVLAENGLSYDCWLFHHNLPELVELAKACPRTRIVCDHVGNPLGHPGAGYSREETFEIWKKAIAELAPCENVVVKLSGLSMPNVGFLFEERKVPPTSAEMADAYEPYFKHCLEVFGPQRCFFASNFPVDKASSSFTVLWNAFKLLAKRLVPDESAQRALFYDNVVRTYRLDQAPFNLPATSAEAEAKKLAAY